MPVFIHLANIIFDKSTLKQKYIGGLEQFRIDWNLLNSEVNQEDDELMSIASMNLDEFQIEKLTARGLEFNAELKYSDDFVVISRYGGKLWKADWLKSNGTFAWHQKCHPHQISRAIEIGEQMTMDHIQKLFEQGIDVFATIKSDI